MNIDIVLSDIKKEIEILKSSHSIDFYYDHAPKSAKFPYVVFRIETILDTSPTTNAILKFMCYDDRNKIAESNIRIADIIHNRFNKYRRSYDLYAYHSVLNIRQSIPSEFLIDKQCIEMQFDLVIYNR